MSYQAINRIKFAPVTPTQKLVLLALADCHHEKTGKCNPSIRYLMSMTGLSDRAIQRSIAELCNANLVTIQRFVGAKTGYHLSTFEHPNPRTTFAPEAGSPPNHVHPSPEGGSPLPRTTFTPPPKEVRGASLKRSKQESNRESNRARKSANPSFPVEMPESYKQPLTEWWEYKREKKKGYVESGWMKLVNQLHRNHDVWTVTAAVNKSMMNGWTGLFPESVTESERLAVMPTVKPEPSEQPPEEDLWEKLQRNRKAKEEREAAEQAELCEAPEDIPPHERDYVW